MTLGFVGGIALAMAGNSIDENRLSQIAQDVRASAVKELAESKVLPEHVCVSIALLNRSTGSYILGHDNGDFMMYPASVVKLPFAAYLGTRLDAGKVQASPELERAVKDMLFESSNDATALVVDVVTGTTGGPELKPDELKKWMDKRQAVNRWLSSLGITGQNACQKTWNEGPYGRERQGYGPNFELRNSMSANATTRIMAELALGKLAKPDRTAWIMGFMKRAVDQKGDEAGGQTKGFIGEALPREWERWSKAGWAYKVRHDVCLFKTPTGKEFILTLYTDQHGSNAKLLPAMTRRALALLGEAGS